MIRKLLPALLCFCILSVNMFAQNPAPSERAMSSNGDLYFQELPSQWDEALPLGNGMIGQLIWQKDGRLRFSLDRADLWDLRPMEHLKGEEYSFQWVRKMHAAGTYNLVQDRFDAPYDDMPAPTKLPAAALEFSIEKLGAVRDVRLDIKNAVAFIRWEKGSECTSFVDATNTSGWFLFKNVPDGFEPEMIPPDYTGEKLRKDDDSHSGPELLRLGYEKGRIIKTGNHINYIQKAAANFEYMVDVRWERKGKDLRGVWSVSSSLAEYNSPGITADETTATRLKTGFKKSMGYHKKWWSDYWSKSVIQVPDTILQKQYYREMYKFGCVARNNTPPISLQAVWTADNGKLPPWKGDYHHDLNTQLSYWPAYKGNHLDLEEGFINWLWQCKPVFQKYTREYFNTDGLNVPGVTTLTGEPMGGWIQYAFSPTVGAWLSHHFYMHWKYSGDRQFLKDKAYPWLKEVSTFIENISVIDPQTGMRQLPISSSPEYNDNSPEAWFKKTTNYDLGLIRWLLTATAELASELSLSEESLHWNNLLDQWPQLNINPTSGALSIAPGVYMTYSHRHLSQQIAYYPLGALDWMNGPEDQKIIKQTILDIDKNGPDYWCGYTYAWMGGLKARARDGEGAAACLKTFAECFCSANSFHLNGDQSGTGKSQFTYRPFTLEGNFAFAAALQDMLLQSKNGIIELLPAIPSEWKDVSFQNLRIEDGYLISLNLKNGSVDKLEIISPCEKEIFIICKFPIDGISIAETKLKIKLKVGKNLILNQLKKF